MCCILCCDVGSRNEASSERVEEQSGNEDHASDWIHRPADRVELETVREVPVADHRDQGQRHQVREEAEAVGRQSGGGEEEAEGYPHGGRETQEGEVDGRTDQEPQGHHC